MSVLREETLNRFPLRAAHLQVLARGNPVVTASETVLPESTSRRLIRELVQWDVLRPAAERYGAYEVVERRLKSAIPVALQERPDLVELLRAPSALPILAALPSGPGPSRRLCAGVSGPTWRNTLAEFHEANIVLRRPGLAWVNEELSGLVGLVEAFRELQARWNDAWAGPRVPGRVVTALPVHQCGVEAAWSVSNAAVRGLPVVEWSRPSFGALSSFRQIAYRGARELDLLDEALLLVRAELDLGYHLRLDDAETIDARISGLLAAGCTRRALETLRFEARFDFYGLGALYRLLRRAFDGERGAIWAARTRYIDELGVPEGAFA